MSSLAETVVRSVSKTPLLRFSTSKFETVLLSASTVLFVSVWVSLNVATVLSMFTVRVCPDAAVSIPVPPAISKD